MDKEKSVYAFPILFILILAASLRFAYFIQIRNDPLPGYMAAREAFDQYRFIEPVKEFLKGNWFGPPQIEYSPAYSYIIAILYMIFPQSVNTIFVFQIVLGILAVYVIYRAAILLFGNKTAALIAAFILSVYSPAIFYECSVLRAPLITYLDLFGFFFLLKALKEGRARYFLFSGLFMGFSSAIRAELLALFLIMYIPLAFKAPAKKKIACMAIFILGLAISLSPVIIRGAVSGRIGIVEPKGVVTFWFGNTRDASGLDCAPLKSHHEMTEESEGNIAKAAGIFLREVNRYPAEYCNLYLRKIKMFLNGYEIPANMSYDLFRSNHSLLRAAFLDFTILAPFAILGFFFALKTDKNLNLLYIFLFILSAPVILFHIMGRYRMPAIPFLIIFAAYFVYKLIRMIDKKKFISLSLTAASFIIVFLYTRPDEAMIKKYFGSRIRCIDYGNLANAYIAKAGEPRLNKEERDILGRKAAANLEKAVEVSQTEYYFKNESLLLGAVYYELKEYDKALRAFSGVLKLEPDNKVAQYYVGLINSHR